MKTLLSYCTAKEFSTALVPLVSLRPCHAQAVNDNNPLLTVRGQRT